jgi:uncharacterized ion transporter superfamily protein YfcC
MRYLSGIVFILFGFGLIIFTWEIPFIPPYYLTIIIVLITIIGVTVATTSVKTFIRGCRTLFSSKYELDDGERKKAIDLFRLLSKSIIIVSLVTFALLIFHAIMVVYYQDDPARELTLFHVAIGLRNFVYGPLIALVCFEFTAFKLKHYKQTKN